MTIAIIGMGYVGLVTAACLAEVGNHVACIDKDLRKIATLNNGAAPFYEPGLDDLIKSGSAAGNLEFHSDLAQGVSRADIVFLAIGTPTAENGHTRLVEILECARHLARTLTKDTLIVIKSTVPVGTCERIQAILGAQYGGSASPRLIVASNPEFLAEGRAIKDFQCPERIVVGCDDGDACQLIEALYKPFNPDGERFLSMDIRSAEFAKYACNAMLAARVSMVNELAGIAGHVGADMRQVCRVLKSDSRIGSKYLQPGAGYGGSCLPKDLRALIGIAQDNGEPATMLRSAEHVNERQGQLLFEAISACLSHDLRGRCVGLWGLAFKPGTDDLREAPSVTLINKLLQAGAHIQAYDPVAGKKEEVQALASNAMLKLCPDAYAACDDADILVVITDWEDFKHPDFALLARKLITATVFDCRNLYETKLLHQHGLVHYQLGQPPAAVAQQLLVSGQKMV